MKKYAFFISVIITTFFSCEGIVGGNGKIISLSTKEPLQNVRVDFYLNNKLAETSLTKNDGLFRGSRFVGCVPKCPPAKLILTKEGYYTDTIDFDKYWQNHAYKGRDSLILIMTPVLN